MYTTFIISKGILYDFGRKVSIFFRHRQINLHIYLKIAFLCVQNNILLIKYSLKIQNYNKFSNLCRKKYYYSCTFHRNVLPLWQIYIMKLNN